MTNTYDEYKCPAHWDATDARGDRVTVASCVLGRGHKGRHHAERCDGEPTHAEVWW